MGTLANVATLLGLLGTVTGLITAFHNIAVTGSGGPAVVSGGIAEALITTAFGLFIGIPTLFFYNYFSKKAADLAITLESTSDRLVVMLGRLSGKARAAEPAPAPAPAPAPRPEPQEDAGWKF
jgi:biopolymer transport protein ExbB/TolQ